MAVKGLAGRLLLAGTLTSGCAPTTGRLADDPLLVSKKLVQGRADVSPGPEVAFAEPSPPALPVQAYLDRAESSRQVASGPSPPHYPIFDPTLTEPVRDSTATSHGAAGFQGIPVARRKGPGIYAHASDYSWLQGLVDQSTQDQLEIRYTIVASEDARGGRARLEDDPRLSQVRVGDVILVEGEMKPAELNSPVSYHIKNIWLIRRAE